jgi:hypothetical protein
MINYHIDNTEVSSVGLGRRPESSTSSSNDHHSKLGNRNRHPDSNSRSTNKEGKVKGKHASIFNF